LLAYYREGQTTPSRIGGTPHSNDFIQHTLTLITAKRQHLLTATVRENVALSGTIVYTATTKTPLLEALYEIAFPLSFSLLLSTR
jgi:hypothetical protein